MFEYLNNLFEWRSFMPHGHCYLWTPEILWTHVVSDSLIFTAYVAIPIALITLIRRRRDIAFNWMFVLFGVFILACGTGHLMNLITVWLPAYRLDGLIKLITAIASVGTAIVLWPLIPKILQLPSPAQLAAVNKKLADEIAERTRAEEEVRTYATQLEAVNKELEAFAYSASHDLRAPLRRIDGFSQMLEQTYCRELPSDAKALLARIRKAAGRSNQLIDDLLEFSRVGRKPLNRCQTAPQLMVPEVFREIKAECPERDVELITGDLPRCSADPALLRQIFVNLLSNAVKYSRERQRARIQVGARRSDHAIEYYVQDNGVGFDMKYAGKLFTPFQRLHAADEYEGSGVGLALVERIVTRHGGTVRAESKPDEGATFYFTLPTAEATPDDRLVPIASLAAPV